ncbi:hypothetical protein G6N82_06185 [Altererythrobacter sp. BO-6]|uniref:hypothetical protein n=1 Tax=Altererythrobacter sp. BO-6 TaxID=2604537 RepID=UPI0013E1E228|nr:hypothetical protein [Altererythrobacter sp. BO-6]QIG53799.1 hypothetical protein G6N82_06185 [Altererythrobacter sp. BO-6]
MIQQEEIEGLRSIYEAKGRKGLVEWVAERRKQLWMVDATPDVLKRHIDLVNRGGWPKELDPLDWRDPQTFEALRSYLSDKLLMVEASDLSPELQRLAGELLAGNLKPRKKAKGSKVSTLENIQVALDCIIALESIGITAHVSKQRRIGHDNTGCAIVAEGLGLPYGEESVINWWKAHRKAEKAKNGVK